MMTKEEYKKELVRMWDSVRDDKSKGRNNCEGVICSECQFCDINDNDNDCYEPINAIEMVEAVEKWSKEHPQKYKISPFEYEYLKLYQKYGFGSDRLCDLTGTTILHELFYLKDIDLNVKVEDILLNCEVTEDVR